MAQSPQMIPNYGFEKKPVRIYACITFGAVGAPTLDASKSKGVASVSRTSAGLFVLTLRERYVSLMYVGARFKLAAGSYPAAPLVQIAAETVASTKTITLQFSDADTPAATDPASGETVCLEIVLNDSSAY